MVLKAIVKLTRSKWAFTQYMTIPAVVVRDSQYPFAAEGEELELIVRADEGEIVLRRPKKE